MSTFSPKLLKNPGQDAATLLSGWSKIYKPGLNSFKRWIPEFALYFIIILVSPFLFAIGFLIWLMIRNATREVREANHKLRDAIANIKLEIDAGKRVTELIYFDGPQEYKTLKSGQSLLKFLGDEMSDMLEIDENGSSFLVQPLMYQSEKFALSFIEFNIQLESLFELYDLDSPQGRFFESIPEKQLWKSRTQAYDYLV